MTTNKIAVALTALLLLITVGCADLFQSGSDRRAAQASAQAAGTQTPTPTAAAAPTGTPTAKAASTTPVPAPAATGTPTVAPTATAVPALPGPNGHGRDIYNQNCVPCHGVSRNNIPVSPLADAAWLQQRGDAVLIANTTNGIRGMPTWGQAKGGSLSDDDIKAVIEYLKQAAGPAATQSPTPTISTTPVVPTVTGSPTASPVATPTCQAGITIWNDKSGRCVPIGLVPLGDTPTPTPTATVSPCGDGTVWNGRQCVVAPTRSLTPTPAAQPNQGQGTPGSFGNFNPYPFYSQSCGPEVNVLGGCVWDIGVEGSLNNANGALATQVGIVKGVSITWGGKVANSSSNGRCALVVLTPNSWFENLTVKDANVTVYNVAPGDVAGWMRTLAVQNAFEQQADYNCPPKKFEDIEVWGSTIPSPPCGTPGFDNCLGTSRQQSQGSSTPAQQPQTAAPATPAPAPTPAAQPAPPKAAPAPAASCETVNCKPRRASVDYGGSVDFASGEAVSGFRIRINGQAYNNCYFASAPDGGTVTDGVANYWLGEVAKMTACAAN